MQKEPQAICLWSHRKDAPQNHSDPPSCSLGPVSESLQFAASEQFHPLFQFFSTFWPQHSKKNTSYCNLGLTYKSNKKWHCSGSVSLALLDWLSTLLQQVHMDNIWRLSCPHPTPSQSWVWPVEGTSRQYEWREGSGIGHFSYWLPPASLLWNVCLPLPVRPLSPSGILEVLFPFTSSDLRRMSSHCYY